MANGENHGMAEAWRAGAVSFAHVAFGVSFLICLAMAALSIGF